MQQKECPLDKRDQEILAEIAAEYNARMNVEVAAYCVSVLRRNKLNPNQKWMLESPEGATKLVLQE